MNILQLAQQIEADHPQITIGRADTSKPLSETNPPSVRDVTPGDWKSVFANIITKMFLLICDYGGGLQDTADCYFNMRGHAVNANGTTTVIVDDPDSAALQGQGLNALVNFDRLTLDAKDAGIPALSTLSIADICIVVDRREPKPIIP